MPEWNLTGPQQQEETTWKLEGPQDQGPTWGEAFSEGAKTLPGQIASDYSPMKLIRTIETGGIDPVEIAKGVKKVVSDPSAIPDMAKGMVKHLYDRYLTAEGWKKAISTDPEGVIRDALVGVMAPEAGAAKLVRGADEAAIAARTASLPGRIAKLPETPTPEPLSSVEQTAKIKSEAGAGIQAAKDAGDTIPASEARGLLDQIKEDTKSEYSSNRHTEAKGWFKDFEDMLKPIKVPKGEKPTLKGVPIEDIPEPARTRLQSQIGSVEPEKQITVKDLHDLRQGLNDVHKVAYTSGREQEGMVASKAKAAIDDFIGNKMDQGHWSTDMRNYALASTAEEIRNLTDRALYRKTNLSAGQKAAALNTELRQWARPTLKGPNARMKMLRKLSPEAADRMEQAATGGTPMDAILRGLGSASPGSIMSFSLDNIAGHLLHGIIPGGPYTIMGIGAAAKYLGGRSVETSIEKIIQTLNDAASAEPKLASLQKAVSPGVFEQLMSRPRTAQAIRNWSKATGDRKRIATIALTAAIAKEVNRPDLQGRIKQEIDNIDPDRSTTVPEQMAQQ